MKKTVFIAASLLLSLAAFAGQPSDQKRSYTYSGRIGKMIIGALKAADVKANCDQNSCKYTITNFYAAEETDGCGGGTTSYDTSFTYPDSRQFTFKYCEGYDGRDYQDKNNKAYGLVQIISELDFFTTAGWTSSASLDVIDCLTDKKISYASCEIKPKN